MNRFFGRSHSKLWEDQKTKKMRVFEAFFSRNRFQLQNLGLKAKKVIQSSAL
jgi:hypothetical protein